MISTYEYWEGHNSVHNSENYLIIDWAMLWTWVDILKGKPERTKLFPSNQMEHQDKTQEYLTQTNPLLSDISENSGVENLRDPSLYRNMKKGVKMVIINLVENLENSQRFINNQENSWSRNRWLKHNRKALFVLTYSWSMHLTGMMAVLMMTLYIPGPGASFWREDSRPYFQGIVFVCYG